MPPQNPEQARWFADEIQPHEPQLRAYLRGRFPALRADLDDLIQETYLRTLRAKKAGRARLSRAYLFVIARNAALDFFRRRRVAAIDPVAEIDRLSVVEERPDAAEALSHDQELALLAEAVNALPVRCREVFILRRFEGASHRDIAQRLGISEHTVNAHLVTGMLKLRHCLRQHGVHAIENACHED